MVKTQMEARNFLSLNFRKTRKITSILWFIPYLHFCYQSRKNPENSLLLYTMEFSRDTTGRVQFRRSARCSTIYSIGRETSFTCYCSSRPLYLCRVGMGWPTCLVTQVIGIFIVFYFFTT